VDVIVADRVCTKSFFKYFYFSTRISKKVGPFGLVIQIWGSASTIGQNLKPLDDTLPNAASILSGKLR
jgi:hypothetical protein